MVLENQNVYPAQKILFLLMENVFAQYKINILKKYIHAGKILAIFVKHVPLLAKSVGMITFA